MNRRDKRKLTRAVEKKVKETEFVPQTIGDVIACTVGFEYHKAKTMREALHAGTPIAKKIIEALKEFKDDRTTSAEG